MKYYKVVENFFFYKIGYIGNFSVIQKYGGKWGILYTQSEIISDKQFFNTICKCVFYIDTKIFSNFNFFSLWWSIDRIFEIRVF